MSTDLETAKTLALIAVVLNVIVLAFGLFFLPLVVLPFIFMILDYILVYEPLSKGRPEDAETPALILAVIQLIPFIGGTVSGIVLILTWIKIKDARSRHGYG